MTNKETKVTNYVLWQRIAIFHLLSRYLQLLVIEKSKYPCMIHIYFYAIMLDDTRDKIAFILPIRIRPKSLICAVLTQNHPLLIGEDEQLYS